MEAHAMHIDAALVQGWLAQVPDPEIPVISITDLGIVREVRVADDGTCHVTITPTYSGCPAMGVIADAIKEALRSHGVERIVLHTRLTPAWTTDWLSDTARDRLRDYGIAPPAEKVIERVIDTSRLHSGLAPQRRDQGAAGKGCEGSEGSEGRIALGGHAMRTGVLADPAAAVSRRGAGSAPRPAIACPQCGSVHTELTSQFGSTPCKALYRCRDCREPFDYFKCH